MSNPTKQLLVFVGSYADETGPGLYVYGLNEETGKLTKLDEVSGIRNPTFFMLDSQRRILYSLGEQVTEEGNKHSEVAAYSINPDSGTLNEVGRIHALDAPSCHIAKDADDRYLVLCSYHGGKIGLVGLQADGLLGAPLDTKVHDRNVNGTERRDRPHPHSANFSPDQRYLFIPDLGLDLIRTYKIEDQTLKLLADTELHPGAGPRHMAFHPNRRLAYVINELDSTVTGFTYDGTNGTLQPFQTISTLPGDFNGSNSCAEIAISENGEFLYGSNRGHDSIVVYAIDKLTGQLSLIQHISSGGGHPRHFSLTPGGRFLLAVNRDGNNLVVYRVEPGGTLTATGHTASLSKPVCVKAAYF